MKNIAKLLVSIGVLASMALAQTADSDLPKDLEIAKPTLLQRGIRLA